MPDRIARVWNGTSWEVITSTAAASNAVVVYQSASPSGPVTGQVWIDSDDSTPYVYTGSSWQSFPNLLAYAPVASPTFTGIPAAPTAAADTNTTQIATTAYVVGQNYLKSTTASSTYAELSGATFTGSIIAPAATTSITSIRLPHGTAPTSPTNGDIWTTTVGVFARINGVTTPLGGATGGGADQVFYNNDQTVTTNYSIPSGKNSMSAGPVTINSGVTVTIPSGSVWSIV